MEKAPPSVTRMLKQLLLHLPCPKHAGTRFFSGFVLGSKNSSPYPWERAGLGRLRIGRVKWWYACGFFSPAASLAEAFEHP
jgi:hypothetical protein